MTARPRHADVAMTPDNLAEDEAVTMELTNPSTDLSTLVSEFAAAVSFIAAKTVWRSGLDRPYRPLLAAANAMIALGEALIAAQAAPTRNGTANAAQDRAQALVVQCLYTPAGRNRSLWMPDHHMSAVIALVALAYRGALHGEAESVAEARKAVAVLAQMGQRGR